MMLPSSAAPTSHVLLHSRSASALHARAAAKNSNITVRTFSLLCPGANPQLHTTQTNLGSTAALLTWRLLVQTETPAQKPDNRCFAISPTTSAAALPHDKHYKHLCHAVQCIQPHSAPSGRLALMFLPRTIIKSYTSFWHSSGTISAGSNKPAV